MDGRGRKSTASLSVVPIGVPTPLAPATVLTKEQAELWREVVATKPIDWFAADSAPLLSEYVRAVTMADTLALRIEACLAGDGEGLKTLIDMRDKEARRVMSLATKMRLSQQSRYTENRAATENRKAGAAGRPWST